MLTTQDFLSFTNFALPLVQSGKAESVGQLLQQWEAQREYGETVDVLKQSYQDMKDGRGTPAEDVFAEVRTKLGLEP
jgi:hypothetical protein